jgi:hypothetical protein
MDWIFDNLQILFVIAAAVAYWLNNLRQAREEVINERDDEPEIDVESVFGPDFDFGDHPEAQHRPQSSQAEVFLPPPITSQPAVTPPPLPGQATPVGTAQHRREFPGGTPTPARPQRPASPHQVVTAEAAVQKELERQQTLEQRLKTLRANRSSRQGGAAATQKSVAAHRASRRSGASAEAPATTPIELVGIRARLKSPQEARRAVVLREILDTPVGMR